MKGKRVEAEAPQFDDAQPVDTRVLRSVTIQHGGLSLSFPDMDSCRPYLDAGYRVVAEVYDEAPGGEQP